ncbi:MAG: polysulfide reductase NrfD [Betaproteobacteria bacterium]|nr:polysulfide reductase NrfD [Betaproteobacteria bacterium]
MEHILHMAYTGYAYPNETVLPWSALIVVYPYITGLVAGAFVISALYKLFNIKVFEPVAHFALLVALCCIVFVPVPLLLHLGHPERALEAMMTPHWSSAFVMFSYFFSFYTILLIVENWFTFRPHAVHMSQHGKSALSRGFYKVVALGSTDLSPKAMAYDEKWMYWLAVIGLPAACGLHGYVGFVFGSVKAREWWSSDLMPVIFILSAVISGSALLLILYPISCKLRKVAIDLACQKALAKTLWGFLIVTLVLEGLELLSMFYRRVEGIDWIARFIAGPLHFTYVDLQWGCGLGALVLLTALVVFRARGRALVAVSMVAGLLVLTEVLMMRWNVVIGGQEISKTLKGMLHYAPPLFGKEGLLVSGAILTLPMIALSIMARLFPPFHDKPADAVPETAK